MKSIEKTVQHCWKPMEEYDPSSKVTDPQEIADILEESSFNLAIEALRKMKTNQFYIACTMYANREGIDLMNTGELNRFVKRLKEVGFDLDGGDAEYGYKMPIPKKGENKRELIIFRRH